METRNATPEEVEAYKAWAARNWNTVQHGAYAPLPVEQGGPLQLELFERIAR